jgi:predicted amidohydrolase YtcJ
MLAFGSDAPVESADPLLGLDAATAWRRRAKWHPDLALSKASALRAYTRDAAFAVGMEGVLGALKPGLLCDLTVLDDRGVAASIVGGKVSWRRTPSSTSRR